MTVDEAWNEFSREQHLSVHIPRVEIPFLRTAFEAGFKSGKVAGIEFVANRINKLREELGDGYR